MKIQMKTLWRELAFCLRDTFFILMSLFAKARLIFIGRRGGPVLFRVVVVLFRVTCVPHFVLPCYVTQIY